MSNATNVSVNLRGSTLAEAAPLTGGGDRPFLEIATPPPVRSVLSIREDGGDERAFEVTEVIEKPTQERAAGCFGRWAPSAELERVARVGSEHLQPTANMSAAPSPVVNMEESGIVAENVGAGPAVDDVGVGPVVAPREESPTPAAAAPAAEPEPEPESEPESDLAAVAIEASHPEPSVAPAPAQAPVAPAAEPAPAAASAAASTTEYHGAEPAEPEASEAAPGESAAAPDDDQGDGDDSGRQAKKSRGKKRKGRKRG